jgi:primosomal protein N' (replication factor Y)
MDEPLPLDLPAPPVAAGVRLRGGAEPAEELPVAQVLLEASVPHLARPFDYGVPATLDAEAVPGVRVRVRFSGRLVSGFLVSRSTETAHTGELAPLERVVSALPVLTPAVLALVQAVADRWAGTLPDVLRLAVPARHAAGERSALAAQAPAPPEELSRPERRTESFPVPADQTADVHAFIAALGEWAAARSEAEGSAPPRAAAALTPGDEPGTGWIGVGLAAAAAVLAAGRSVLWVVPDHRELTALTARLGPLGPLTVRLSADQGPQARWSAWVRAHTGAARLVIGTRAASLASLPDLGLVLLLEDGSDHYAEPRAPYPHAREICLLRSRLQDAALLLLGTDRTVEVQRLAESGWLASLERGRAERRETAPLVLIPRAESAAERMPPDVFEVIRDALGRSKRETAVGPVLVQVPRAGYLPVVACARCGDLLVCPRCEAHLSAAGPTGPFACAQCGLRTGHAQCGRCRSERFRAVVRGVERTVEELTRAFSGFPVLRSAGEEILHSVPDEPSVVVATTGAEPYAEGGYAAAVLLDTLWPGPGLDGIERAVSRRLRALSLVRAASHGGRALVLDDTPAVVRTLQTFDPVGAAAAVLADRRATRLPPAVRTLQLRGERRDVTAFLAEVEAQAPQALRLLLTEEEPHSRLLAFDYGRAAEVCAAVRAVSLRRSAAGEPIVRHVVDPHRAL